MKEPRRFTIFLGLLLAAAALVYGGCLRPAGFGSYHDEGIYVVTAKALATGHGYRIISLPQAPAQTKYPPLYPFLLSLVWRLHPHFPGNLIPMMILSGVATVGFLFLVYYYLVRQGYAEPGAALVIVLLTGLNVIVIYLATTVLSDMLYAALSVAALWLVEVSDKPSARVKAAVAAGSVLGLTFLTRQVGASVIAAAVVYLLWRRSYRSLLGLAVAVILIVGPWGLWCRIQDRAALPTGLEYYTNYSHAYVPLFTDVRLLGAVLVQTGPAVLTSMSTIFFSNMINFDSGLDMALVAGTFALLILGATRWLSAELRLLHIYLILYLAVLTVTPFQQYDRYLVPILPFLLLPLLKSGRQQWSYVQNLWPRRREPRALIMLLISWSLLLVCFTGLTARNGLVLARFVRWMASGDISQEELYKDQPVFSWVRNHTEKSDVVATAYDPVYYLYTGRPAIRLRDDASLLWRFYKENARAAPARELLDVLRCNQVRYVIVRPSHPAFQEITALAGQYPRMFVPIHRFAETQTQVYRIDRE